MSERNSILEVMDILKVTEELDADFFLLEWANCENDDERRKFIKSFRKQIAQVALVTAIVPLRDLAVSQS